mmetsp:Transcript_14125/g.42258  ORF Transcript_14125/g.42258 Transcript_14125/m.42258 type:complete len:147 (+) Transcript_14125:1021-1461(+)
MDTASLAALPRPGPGRLLPLRPPTIDAAAEAERIEGILRTEIATWRAEYGLKTSFDEGLSYGFSTALEAYELERKHGVSFGLSDFDDAVRRAVPLGHVFKGYPTCFGHRHAKRMFQSLADGDVPRAILAAQVGSTLTLNPNPQRPS